MGTRVSSARLVGRTAELAELEAALADAAAGRPSLAFVAGESGVGKTRLLAELERRCAERHGARVIGGDCIELGEGELPYAPLVAALRPLVRRADPVLEAVGPAVRAELATLAPALAGTLATLGSSSGSRSLSSEPLEEPGGEASAHANDPDARARLFEALLALLDALGQDAPVLLSIEDLHWADRSTRSFLSYLAASLCNERVLVVCTYRSDELHRRHPLRPLLAELERDKRARRIDLEPLTRAELDEQLADILGAPAERKLGDRLWARSEGNPLFTEELLAAGLDGSAALPPTLRDALMVRVERLPADAQELLRLVAIAQRADHELLADAGVLEPRALREAVREAVAANILVVDDEGRYHFRHALLREVVQDDLLPGEARELHRALADALAPRVRPGAGGALLAAGVAHHLLAAGDEPAALTASIRAAQAALEVHAYAEAAALIDRALELWDRVPDAPERAGMDEIDLLSIAANARDVDGDITRQKQLLMRALELVDAEAEPERAARLLDRLHRAQFTLGRQDEAIATLDRAIALLPPGPGAARAALLASKAKAYMLRSRYRDTIAAAHDAIEAAEAAGDRLAETRARNALGVALMGIGEMDEGIASLRRAWAIAEELDDPREIGSAATNLSDQLHLHGRTDEALEIVREGMAGAHLLQTSVEWLSMCLSEYVFETGDWQAAESYLPQRMRRRVGISLICLHLRRGELALGRGDLEVARTELEAASTFVRDSVEPQFLGIHGSLMAELRRREGELDAARCVVEDTLDRIEFCSEDAPRVARVATTGVKVEADAAQHARDLGDAQEEQAAIARAEALVARVAAAAAEPERPVEQAFLLTAFAEQSRARGASDPELWHDAADAWAALGRRYLEAQMAWREAEARLERGDRDGATAAAARAHADALEFGSAWLTDEVQALAARGRLRLDGVEAGAAADGAAADGAPAAGDGDPFGLTPRERQVLGLVARGATNREIGETLYMAEKTASVHVSRILAKLDVRSRTEAAGVAHRLGLADG